jgi:hypothetical protein
MHSAKQNSITLGIQLFYSPMRWIWLIVLMLAVFGVYCFFHPLVLSIDSTYGFLAYKGTIFFHSFNVIPEISTADISQVNPVFVSWWSPGQWLFPGLLNYILGIRLGIAAIIITLVSLISGFIGYYRVFIFYKFSFTISIISLLIIFSSSTLYYCFIIYQGGEILEFAFFPWFLLFVARIRRISSANLLGIATFFLFCFIAKTTLLIYCNLVLIAKLFRIFKPPSGNRIRFSFKSLILLLPAFVLTVLISVFYLSRGPSPELIHHFGVKSEGILVPLTSPLCSILSIQQWIERVDRIFSGSLHASRISDLILVVLYLIILGILVWIFRRLIISEKIDPSYKQLFFILYGGLSVFFIVAYSFSANIDFSSRHFKLMGYLFVPGFMTVLYQRIRQSWINTGLILFTFLCIIDVLYLKEKWIRDRYISANYFYRDCETPPNRDKLDIASYNKLLDLDRRFEKTNSGSLVLFVESTADIAVDLHHPCILQTPGKNIRENIFRKAGPVLCICISKSTLTREPRILQSKFPDYGNFTRIAETNHYFFFQSSKDRQSSN